MGIYKYVRSLVPVWQKLRDNFGMTFAGSELYT